MNNHKLTWLKVKQKHIGEEPGIIKHQEQKWAEKARQARERAGLEAKKKSNRLLRLQAEFGDKFMEMVGLAKDEGTRQRLLERSSHYLERLKTVYDHRIDVVRPEARATNIAYGYLRGREYFEIENTVIDNNFARLGLSPEFGRRKLWSRVFRIVSEFSELTLTDAEVAVKSWRKKHPQYREMNTDDLA